MTMLLTWAWSRGRPRFCPAVCLTIQIMIPYFLFRVSMIDHYDNISELCGDDFEENGGWLWSGWY